MDQPRTGLPALPASLWHSWEIRAAVAAGEPGTVVAIARRAHGMRQDELGVLAGFSQSAISRLESGSNLAYDLRILRTLCKLLGIPARLLGLAEDAPPERVPALFGVLDHLVGTATVAPELASHLLITRRIVNDADNWHTSGPLTPAVRQLYQLADRLRRSARGALRRDMLRIAALYAEFFGWLREENGDLTAAGQWTARALEQGQAADDRNIVAYAFVRMSQLAEVDGDADRVIGLARAAQREQGVTDRVRTIALQQEARGYARAGSEEACLSRLDRVAAMADEFEPIVSDEYVIGYCYNRHHVDLQRAACLLTLDRPRDAVRQYEESRPTWASVCRWEQGVHAARLAFALARCGELDHAAVVGFEALEIAGSADSALVRTELRRLREWSDVPAIAELTELAEAR
ncbi:MAG TPA: helix-turn-helix transcriptional regulator [Pseudonocardiaceae bacterium]|jgi:transcriptional regulator with XRE-family HTH domain|nr:helix-turn-helix transcriptional regulator [Pseudonocardiaceae bacterium]